MVGVMVIALVVFSGCSLDKNEEVNQNEQVEQVSSENWNEYENKNLGFKIKYPDEWVYEESFTDFGGRMQLFKEESDTDAAFPYVEVQVYTSKESLDDIARSDYSKDENGNYISFYSPEGEPDKVMQSKITKNGDWVYNISLFSKIDEENENLFKEITESFVTFFRTIRVPDIDITEDDIKKKTSGWKTYDNNGMDFEVKYPSDFEVVDIEKGVMVATEELPGAHSENYRKKQFSIISVVDEKSLDLAVIDEISKINESNNVEIFTKKIELEDNEALYVGSHYDNEGGVVSKLFIKNGPRLYTLEARSLIYEEYEKDIQFVENEFALFFNTFKVL